MEKAGALNEENLGTREERGVEPRESRDAVVAGAKRERPEAGRESHFIRKMPESGDGRTIRPNESQGEAEKTDLGSARGTISEKLPKRSRTVAQNEVQWFPSPSGVPPHQRRLMS